MSSRLSSEPGAGFCYFLENKLGHMGADGGTASRRCATAGFSHGQLDQLSWPLNPSCLVHVQQPGWGFWTHRWVETGFGQQLTSADTLGAKKKGGFLHKRRFSCLDRHDSFAFVQEYTRYYSCGKEKLWADKIELNVIILDCLSFKRAYPNHSRAPSHKCPFLCIEVAFIFRFSAFECTSVSFCAFESYS